MSSSANNGIPFVPENTIDPASGLNEAINTIDATLQLAVLTAGGNSPPAAPAEGDRHAVGPNPAGAWAGKTGMVARYLDGYWSFFVAHIALCLADSLIYTRIGSEWVASKATVSSVAGRTGDVVLSKVDVGLDNVNNTADADKPISTVQQSALDQKLSRSGGALTGPVTSSSSAQFTSMVLNSPTATLINGGVTHTPNNASAVMSMAKNADVISELIAYSDISSAMPRLQLLKARGTAAAPTIGADGDFAGTFQFYVYRGDVFGSIGGVFALVDGPPVANSYVPGRVEFRTTLDATGPRTVWQFKAAGHMQPGSDNVYDIGSASLRARVIYAGTGAINTSDAREKTPVRALTGAEIAAAKDLAKEIGAYKFLNCVREKGEEARSHIGMTVQRAIEILNSHDLDPMEYGFVCHDTWASSTVNHEAQVHTVPVADEDGAVTYQEAVLKEAWVEQLPAGDRYGFRMDELLAFIAAGFEARLAALEQNA
ncbi:DUF2793 domain-containing protein [Pseudomonas gingeri]|uniref:DUF2793 domain-containing protein n=1 Tax=Pseudomonas gingeri TaxID=117681 RepID=UPI0015A3ADF4|nr:DUF2793 domain-containing protein [Pseudomonas gingeri]NWA25522.1 DUF2793 domain-containing protein [Pseudomonas gingeri]